MGEVLAPIFPLLHAFPVNAIPAKPAPRAGSIAVRRSRGRTFVLLVNAKGTRERVFPKGHVEAGESAEIAALRELEEEAGIQGRILADVGEMAYRAGSEKVRVRYFLVLATARVGKGEKDRDPIWLDPRAALTLLAFDNARDLLRKLLPKIDRIGAHVTPAPEGFDQLLRTDLEHLGASLLQNEESGEKRVTFFITLVTATAGALGFFGDKMHPRYGAGWRALAVGALMALLVFGYQTLRRLVERNATTDGFKLRMNRIRRYFATTSDPSHRAFLAFDPDRPKARTTPPWPWSGRGGWLETVVLVNAVLVGAVVGVLTWKPDAEWRIATTAAVVIISWLVLHWLTALLHRRRWEREAAGL